MAKQTLVRITTPVGIAVYPKLEKPDTKFDPIGAYSVNLDLSPKEAEGLITQIKKIADAAYTSELKEKGKKTLKRADMPWSETEDGQLRFKFRLKAQGGSGDNTWTQKPAIFDASGVPVANLNIGSGTRMKVAFEVAPYFTAMLGCGVSLRLKAVQIVELKEWIGGDNFDAFGFKATDGYVKQTEASAPASSGDIDF
jgi:hypothetical protein